MSFGCLTIFCVIEKYWLGKYSCKVWIVSACYRKSPHFTPTGKSKHGNCLHAIAFPCTTRLRNLNRVLVVSQNWICPLVIGRFCAIVWLYDYTRSSQVKPWIRSCTCLVIGHWTVLSGFVKYCALWCLSDSVRRGGQVRSNYGLGVAPGRGRVFQTFVLCPPVGWFLGW